MVARDPPAAAMAALRPQPLHDGMNFLLILDDVFCNPRNKSGLFPAIKKPAPDLIGVGHSIKQQALTSPCFSKLQQAVPLDERC